MRVTLLILAALATIANSQSHAQIAAPAEPYVNAVSKAQTGNKWLITYVGCPVSIRIEGSLTAYCDSLPGFEAGVVVISGPWKGDHVWYKTLRNPTDTELRQTFRSLSSPPMITPTAKVVSFQARTFQQQCTTGG